MSRRLANDIAAAIMTPDPVCAEPSTTLRQLVRLLHDNDISGCPVVDHDGKVIGVVSKSDLLRRWWELLCTRCGEDDDAGDSPRAEPPVCVQQFMTEAVVTAGASAPIYEVASRMSNSRVHRVVVVDDDMFPLGVITALDVLKRFPRPTG